MSNIELPPLPKDVLGNKYAYDAAQMQAYARAAVELNLQRLANPDRKFSKMGFPLEPINQRREIIRTYGADGQLEKTEIATHAGNLEAERAVLRLSMDSLLNQRNEAYKERDELRKPFWFICPGCKCQSSIERAPKSATEQSPVPGPLSDAAG